MPGIRSSAGRSKGKNVAAIGVIQTLNNMIRTNVMILINLGISLKRKKGRRMPIPSAAAAEEANELEQQFGSLFQLWKVMRAKNWFDMIPQVIVLKEKRGRSI
jgi:hypothetical protein